MARNYRLLGAIRERAGLRPHEFADAVGIPRGSVYNYVRGREPQAGRALRIANALGMRVEDLWEEEKK